MDIEELMFCCPMSDFLKIALGDLENAPLPLRTARLLAQFNVPSIHIQFYDLDKPDLPLEKPLVWNQRYWHLDLQRRRRMKEKHELERLACNKQSENIAKWTKFFMRHPYYLPEKTAKWTAEQIVINKDQSFAKAMNIQVEQFSDEEWTAAHDYNEMLKFRTSEQAKKQQ